MTTNELLALAQIIKTETVKNKNSGVRIGTAFEEVVKKLELNEDEISKLRGMVESGGSSSSLISLKTFTKYTIINGTLIEI